MDAIQGFQVLRSRNGDKVRVGFTGTRQGMTTSQWQTVEDLMTELFKGKQGTFAHNGLVEWHDGDCVGADDQAHGVAEKLQAEARRWGETIDLYGHPCNLNNYRAWNDFDFTAEVKAPLVRNRDIVNESDVMIAAPKEYENVDRGSGTWATIRYAWRRGVKTWLVWPNGEKELLSDRAASLGIA